MKTKTLIFFSLLLAVMAGFFAESGVSSPPMGGLYRLGLGVDGKATTDGPTRLRLRILDANRRFDSVIIKISTIGNIKYLGNPVWVYKPGDSLNLTYYLNVLIPRGDTSGIAADLWLDEARHFVGTEIYFVTTGDSVESYRLKPTPPEPRQPDMGTPDSLLPDFGKPLVYTKDRGYVDIDSSGVNHLPTGAEQKQLFEKEPLTRDYGQLVYANGVPYIRLRGETKFHLADSSEMNDSVRIINSSDLTDKMIKAAWEMAPLKYANGQNLEAEGQQWHRRRGERLFLPADSIRVPGGLAEDSRKRWEATKNNPVDMTMDLRKSEDYEFVRRLFPDLKPMDSAGYYHVMTTRKEVPQVEQHGIRIGKYPNLPPDTTRRVKPDSLLRPQHRKTTSQNIH